ncbi:hypothetical protein ACFW08_36235, partial [Streptomyces sp. NPDC058960]|uniref:hypothetical protein n=1 Tax=Streptomyces sp. NPDC058960 TaxID=3346679 RepID=UPI0036B9BDAC
WQSTRSRLSTYFVGALVLDFPNTYRSWLARWSRSAAEEPLDLLGAFDIESPQRGPESTVEARDEVVRLWNPTDERSEGRCPDGLWLDDAFDTSADSADTCVPAVGAPEADAS